MIKLFEKVLRLTALSAVGVSFSFCGSPYVKLEEEHGTPVEKETSVKRYEFEVERPIRVAELEIHSTLKAGTMIWRFSDPVGRTVWEGRTHGKLGERRNFDPVLGKWRLELSFREATGDYQVHWIAREQAH